MMSNPGKASFNTDGAISRRGAEGRGMDLYQRLLDEAVENVDYRDLIAVSPDAAVGEAIKQMKTRRLGCVVVVDNAGKPQGIFTARLVVKLLLRSDGKSGNAMAEPVSQHMVTPPAIVKPGASVAELFDCMESNKTRFVCVVDGAGRASAVVGQKGVVKFLASHYPHVVQGNTLESTLNVKTREGA